MFICADKARLLRWDRSVVAITRTFCYASSKSDYLQDFFWRLGNAEAARRGRDISVTVPAAVEDQKARLELNNLKQDERLYVYDDNNSRFYTALR